MDFRFKVSSQARRDLNRIGQHIARDNPSGATDFCDQLLDLAESLTTFPWRHGSFAKRPNIKKVAHEAYLIFYKIDEETRTVKILRFWHASRNQDRLRLKESPEKYSTSAQPLAAQVVH
jgi:toxin ParE1/3/4